MVSKFQKNFEMHTGRATGKIYENKPGPKTNNVIDPEK
jgi:hypothetical protein